MRPRYYDPQIGRFIRRARAAQLLPWMGSIGDCVDNAVMEYFWARGRVELFNRRLSTKSTLRRQ
jgi:transposase InsO family protein